MDKVSHRDLIIFFISPQLFVDFVTAHEFLDTDDCEGGFVVLDDMLGSNQKATETFSREGVVEIWRFSIYLIPTLFTEKKK